MAFDSRYGGRTSRPTSPALHPTAPRPSAAEWGVLREDGIQWEGQVLLAGAGMDLPALLVLTHSRLVLVANGAVALDVPRAWLRPEPKLLTGGHVRLSVTPQDRSRRPGDTDRLTVAVRSGRAEAARLVSTLTGRVVSPREERGITASEQPGAWAQSVGAATPMALPPLPDFDDDPILTRANRSWPPVEQEGVPAASPSRRRPAPAPEATLSNWVANHDPAALETPASPATHRNPTWPADQGGPHEDHRQFNRGLVWGLRSLILALLVGTAVYFGYDRLPADVNFRLPAALEDRFGLYQDDPPPTDVSQVPAGTDGDDEIVPSPTTPSEDGTSGGWISDTEPTQNGVGGNQGEITPVDPGIGTYANDDGEESAGEPPVETVEEPADEPVEDDTTDSDAPVDDLNDTGSNDIPVGNGDPNRPPVTEEPIVEEPVETEVPATEEPVETEVPVTEEPVETEVPPTEVPVETEIPATEEPVETEVPVTEEPVETEVPATEEPVETEVPVEPEPTEIPGRQDETPTPEVEAETPEPDPTLESQPPSVNPEVPPAQEVASGTFRYAVTGASRGQSIEALPNLAAVETGEWVVLTVAGQNISDIDQVFDMSQFRLYADGQEVLLDVGNAWVSGLLGQVPTYGNTDAILWAGGEGHDFTLTFLAPLGTESLVLVAGDQALDLSSSLGSAALTSTTDGAAQPSPEAIEAQVVGVLDAETIVVEIDGIRQTVRYVGVDVPTGDTCFAPEATAANQALVEGQLVRLERQSTDTDARGNWVRDVWVQNADGAWILASEALVSQGAAAAGISQPNTRFAGWLQGSQAIAEAEGAGLWGACATGEVAGGEASGPDTIVLRPGFQYLD